MLQIVSEPMALLGDADRVPISFEVTSVLEATVEAGGLGGIRLRERPLSEPYLKDYDLDAGGGPSRLAERFDLSNWGLLFAREGGELVGSCLIGWDTPDAFLLEGRRDLAVLWDLRVCPNGRGRGIGGRLFVAAEQWARQRGCTQLKVETQNINVPACRFYASRGCELGAMNRYAYPALPHEVQLLWYKALGETT